MGRFINADAYASTGQGILGNNMFAYCLNNPISRVEIGGYLSEKMIDDSEIDVDHTDDPLGGGGIQGDGTRESPYVGGSYYSGQNISSPGGSHQYTPPSGGGGASSTTTAKGVKIDFGHGGRHAEQSGYNHLDIQAAIVQDLFQFPKNVGTTANVVITYDGARLLYTFHYVSPYYVNVGTYFFIR